VRDRPGSVLEAFPEVTAGLTGRSSSAILKFESHAASFRGALLREPGIHNHEGYGFRARHLAVAPWNDWAKLVNRFAHMISFTESLYW
jgi:hypothetical protein